MKGRLQSQITPVSRLSETAVHQLFTIFARHYEQVTWLDFKRDLHEKHFVILLNDSLSGEPVGFSTQQIISCKVEETPLRAIFSGDTIIDRAYWGERELIRSWCHFAGTVRATEPQTRLFWFLISKGYRTYLFLPLFYREFFPRFDAPTPAFEQKIIDTLATARYPEFYQQQSGLLEFPRSHGQLTAELAEIPAARRHHPHVDFFLARNPKYATGSELVCLAEISARNMKSFAATCLTEGERISSLPQNMELHHVA